MKIQGNHVLIEPLPKRLKSDGGISLVERYRDDEMQWRVLAVGAGRIVRKKGKPDVLIPIEVEVGDCVLTPMIHGNKFSFENGSGWLVIEYDELIAVWKDEKSRS